MEKCKFCQQELEKGVTVCPHCGKDQSLPVENTTEQELAQEAQNRLDLEEPKKKATPGKIALAVAAVVALAAVLAALIYLGLQKEPDQPLPETTAAATEPAPTVEPTIPEDGNPEDVTCKGSYTVTDQQAQDARERVVATIGDNQLTNGLLQVYYWSAVNSLLSSQQGYYLMAYGGIDYQQPLDTQICPVNTELTWQQHFLQQALNNWRTSCALAAEAKKAGVEMTQEERQFIDTMESYLTETAQGYGMTLEELLLKNVGPGAGLGEFVTFQENYSSGSGYYNAQIAKLVPTEEELAQYYADHEQEYATGGLTKDSKFVNVRHILISPEGGTTDEETGATTYTEEAWEACRQEAQAILDQFLAGDKTEDSFAALANEKSQDGGSNTAGGLYENVFEGQMVAPFEDWCFDESRKTGDTGLVKTDFGYHVMYFVDSTPQWKYYAGQDWLLEKTNEFIDSVTEAYPMDVQYDQIELGYLELGQ